MVYYCNNGFVGIPGVALCNDEVLCSWDWVGCLWCHLGVYNMYILEDVFMRLCVY